MKKLFKVLGTIAMLAVLVLSLAACDNLMDFIDQITGNNNQEKTLTLSGQVNEMMTNDDPPSVSYQAYNGEKLTVSVSGMTEKGTITNGQLSITLGKPTSLENLKDESHDSDLTISPSSAKGFMFQNLNIENSDDHQNLGRINFTINSSDDNVSVTMEMVGYWYVDRDVTISSKEKTETDDYPNGYTTIYTTKAISLALKAGWNTLYIKEEASMKNEGDNIIEERTTTISLGNPSSLKWVLDFDGSSEKIEGGDEGDGLAPIQPAGNILSKNTWTVGGYR